ncbi:MAG: HAMP domain-containing sensor histidine kinase [Verrucomicrobia bacterium]|nr:HAMP domain-containing sensor histidine kinase [Verrucomicrobiota bacterium]
MTATPSITGFRLRVLLGIMLVVGAVTALALWSTQHKVTAEVQQQLQQAFQSEIAALHRAWEVRHAALVERSRSLARKPRIHAALEDNALDLLYPNAEDELRDLMEGGADHPLQALFYRFLDADGKVIAAPAGVDAGKLSSAQEAKLSLAKLPGTQQVGYLTREGGMAEIIAAPIISTDTHEVIASIVLGFKPFDLNGQSHGMQAGIWTSGQLFLPEASAEACTKLAALMKGVPTGSRCEVAIAGMPHLVFSQLLNPDSLFPAAYEVCVYSLAAAEGRRQQLRWQILSAGVLLLLGAGAASHLIAGRLAVPVERLAVDSACNVLQREEAEAALQQTSVELQRSMRFSADTSHQLKTPITVLRAGLEELQQQPGMTRLMREEIDELIFQTTKLASMIHDLLLLSRLDAGRLQLQMTDLDLTRFIDSLADDLSAVPGALDFEVAVEVARDVHILGEPRYLSMILQNLLENAWKYNVPHGVISISAHEHGDMLALRIGNTGPGIPAEAQDHVFDRFHRAAVGENVPGHGLGLNIARELALLHGGDLRLLRSAEGWTEFEVSFRLANPLVSA